MVDPRFTDTITVEYIDHMGDDAKIAHAARVSTKGLDNQQGRIEGLVKALWREGHYSPFEHSALTAAVAAPMFVRDQMVRHKSMSFSVESARYKQLEPVFYVPSFNRPLVQTGKALDYRREPGSPVQHAATAGSIEYVADAAWTEYEELINNGVAKEVARSVLPTSIYTHLWVTGSLRSWLHFLDQRLDEHAQWEIRNVAAQVEGIIKQYWPIAWEAWSK